MVKEENYYIDGHDLNDVRNSNEILVIESIKRIRGEFHEFDNCTIYLEDVYAASLNKLQPKYRQNVLMIDSSDVLDQDSVDKVARETFERVIKNPRHS